MRGRVYDDFLTLERRIEVRNDPDAPGVPERERLGRRSVFTAGTEGTLVELRWRRRLDERPARARSPRAARGDDGFAPGERVFPELAAQVPPSRPRNGLKMSIGAGKTIVVACEAPSSSIVCK